MWPHHRSSPGGGLHRGDILEVDFWVSRLVRHALAAKTETELFSNLLLAAISGFVLWLVIIFLLPETLRYRVGNGGIHGKGSWLLFPPTLSSPLAPEPERGPKPPKPSLMGYWKLFSYPPIGIISVNTAILYLTYFAIAVQLPYALEDVYHWSTTAVGAGYLAVGIALVIGSVIGGRANDWRRARLVRARDDEKVEPETRLVDQIWGVILCAAGTIMYGWFVDRAIHPAAVLVATFLSTIPLDITNL